MRNKLLFRAITFIMTAVLLCQDIAIAGGYPPGFSKADTIAPLSLFKYLQKKGPKDITIKEALHIWNRLSNIQNIIETNRRNSVSNLQKLIARVESQGKIDKSLLDTDGYLLQAEKDGENSIYYLDARLIGPERKLTRQRIYFFKKEIRLSKEFIDKVGIGDKENRIQYAKERGFWIDAEQRYGQGSPEDTGLCVTGDTVLPLLVNRFSSLVCVPTRIVDVKPGDYVLSLNEETQQIEPHRINELLDMGIKPVYRLTTASGRSIKTTANHPYLTRNGWIKVSGLHEGDEIGAPNTNNKMNRVDYSRLIRYLLRSIIVKDFCSSSGFTSLSNRFKTSCNFSTSLRISERNLNTMIPGCVPKGYNIRLAKSRSQVMRTASCFSARDKTSPLAADNLLRLCSVIVVNLNFSRRFFVLPRTDSSIKNLILSCIQFFKEMYFFIFNKLICILNAGIYICYGQLGKIIFRDNLFRFNSCAQKIQDLPNHNAMSFDTRFPMTNIWIYRNAIKHNFTSQQHYFNTITQKLSRFFFSMAELDAAEMPLTHPSPRGGEGKGEGGILWDRIASIEYIGYEHVYDIEVEGTHNFIGNGIFAHNTFIEESVNVTCGTICELGHEGSHDSLDSQLERQFEELRKILSPGYPCPSTGRRGKGEGALTEKEADKALVEYAKKFGIDIKCKELKDFRRQIKEAEEGLRGIEIFFSIPETGTELFWVGKDYAGGHYNREGTRMHLSLPVILRHGIGAGVAIAKHDLCHIKEGRHKDDEGIGVVKKIAGLEEIPPTTFNFQGDEINIKDVVTGEEKVITILLDALASRDIKSMEETRRVLRYVRNTDVLAKILRLSKTDKWSNNLNDPTVVRNLLILKIIGDIGIPSELAMRPLRRFHGYPIPEVQKKAMYVYQRLLAIKSGRMDPHSLDVCCKIEGDIERFIDSRIPYPEPEYAEAPPIMRQIILAIDAMGGINEYTVQGIIRFVKSKWGAEIDGKALLGFLHNIDEKRSRMGLNKFIPSIEIEEMVRIAMTKLGPKALPEDIRDYIRERWGEDLELKGIRRLMIKFVAIKRGLFRRPRPPVVKRKPAKEPRPAPRPAPAPPVMPARPPAPTPRPAPAPVVKPALLPEQLEEEAGEEREPEEIPAVEEAEEVRERTTKPAPKKLSDIVTKDEALGYLNNPEVNWNLRKLHDYVAGKAGRLRIGLIDLLRELGLVEDFKVKYREKYIEKCGVYGVYRMIAEYFGIYENMLIKLRKAFEIEDPEIEIPAKPREPAGPPDFSKLGIDKNAALGLLKERNWNLKSFHSYIAGLLNRKRIPYLILLRGFDLVAEFKAKYDEIYREENGIAERIAKHLGISTITSSHLKEELEIIDPTGVVRRKVTREYGPIKIDIKKEKLREKLEEVNWNLKKFRDYIADRVGRKRIPLAHLLRELDLVEEYRTKFNEIYIKMGGIYGGIAEFFGVPVNTIKNINKSLGIIAPVSKLPEDAGRLARLLDIKMGKEDALDILNSSEVNWDIGRFYRSFETKMSIADLMRTLGIVEEFRNKYEEVYRKKLGIMHKIAYHFGILLITLRKLTKDLKIKDPEDVVVIRGSLLSVLDRTKDEILNLLNGADINWNFGKLRGSLKIGLTFPTKEIVTGLDIVEEFKTKFREMYRLKQGRYDILGEYFGLHEEMLRKLVADLNIDVSDIKLYEKGSILEGWDLKKADILKELEEIYKWHLSSFKDALAKRKIVRLGISFIDLIMGLDLVEDFLVKFDEVYKANSENLFNTARFFGLWDTTIKPILIEFGRMFEKEAETDEQKQFNNIIWLYAQELRKGTPREEIHEKIKLLINEFKGWEVESSKGDIWTKFMGSNTLHIRVLEDKKYTALFEWHEVFGLVVVLKEQGKEMKEDLLYDLSGCRDYDEKGEYKRITTYKKGTREYEKKSMRLNEIIVNYADMIREGKDLAQIKEVLFDRVNGFGIWNLGEIKTTAFCIEPIFGIYNSFLFDRLPSGKRFLKLIWDDLAGIVVSFGKSAEDSEDDMLYDPLSFAKYDRSATKEKPKSISAVKIGIRDELNRVRLNKVILKYINLLRGGKPLEEIEKEAENDIKLFGSWKEDLLVRGFSTTPVKNNTLVCKMLKKGVCCISLEWVELVGMALVFHNEGEEPGEDALFNINSYKDYNPSATKTNPIHANKLCKRKELTFELNRIRLGKLLLKYAGYLKREKQLAEIRILLAEDIEEFGTREVKVSGKAFSISPAKNNSMCFAKLSQGLYHIKVEWHDDYGLIISFIPEDEKQKIRIYNPVNCKKLDITGREKHMVWVYSITTKILGKTESEEHIKKKEFNHIIGNYAALLREGRTLEEIKGELSKEIEGFKVLEIDIKKNRWGSKPVKNNRLSFVNLFKGKAYVRLMWDDLLGLLVIIGKAQEDTKEDLIYDPGTYAEYDIQAVRENPKHIFAQKIGNRDELDRARLNKIILKYANLLKENRPLDEIRNLLDRELSLFSSWRVNVKGKKLSTSPFLNNMLLFQEIPKGNYEVRLEWLDSVGLAVVICSEGGDKEKDLFYDVSVYKDYDPSVIKSAFITAPKLEERKKLALYYLKKLILRYISYLRENRRLDEIKGLIAQDIEDFGIRYIILDSKSFAIYPVTNNELRFKYLSPGKYYITVAWHEEYGLIVGLVPQEEGEAEARSRIYDVSPCRKFRIREKVKKIEARIITSKIMGRPEEEIQEGESEPEIEPEKEMPEEDINKAVFNHIIERYAVLLREGKALKEIKGELLKEIEGFKMLEIDIKKKHWGVSPVKNNRLSFNYLFKGKVYVRLMWDDLLGLLVIIGKAQEDAKEDLIYDPSTYAEYDIQAVSEDPKQIYARKIGKRDELDRARLNKIILKYANLLKENRPLDEIRGLLKEELSLFSSWRVNVKKSKTLSTAPFPNNVLLFQEIPKGNYEVRLEWLDSVGLAVVICSEAGDREKDLFYDVSVYKDYNPSYEKMVHITAAKLEKREKLALYYLKKIILRYISYLRENRRLDEIKGLMAQDIEDFGIRYIILHSKSFTITPVTNNGLRFKYLSPGKYYITVAWHEEYGLIVGLVPQEEGEAEARHRIYDVSPYRKFRIRKKVKKIEARIITNKRGSGPISGEKSGEKGSDPISGDGELPGEKGSVPISGEKGSVPISGNITKDKDVAGKLAGDADPKLKEWLKQNTPDNTKVIDYYYEGGKWTAYKVKYIENYTYGMDDKGEQMTDVRYQMSEEEQGRLNEALEECTYDETGRQVRFRIVLGETAVGWSEDKNIDHSSFIHVGKRTATIWYGEGLFRDLLSRDTDPLRNRIFSHEKRHILGEKGIDEGREYEDLTKDVCERCRKIEERQAEAVPGDGEKDDKGLCVTGDTILPLLVSRSSSLVYVPTRIVDVKPGDYVLSLNEETQRIEPHRINGLLDMGVKPVYRLTTASGRSIKTTANHPYLTRSGWVKVSGLRAGDDIGVPELDFTDSDSVFLDNNKAAKQILFRDNSEKVINQSDDFVNGQEINSQKDNATIGFSRITQDVAKVSITGYKDIGLLFYQFVNFLIQGMRLNISNIFNLITRMFKFHSNPSRAVSINKKFHRYLYWLINKFFFICQYCPIHNTGLNIFNCNWGKFFFDSLKIHSGSKCLKNYVYRDAGSFYTRPSMLDFRIDGDAFFYQFSANHFNPPPVGNKFNILFSRLSRVFTISEAEAAEMPLTLTREMGEGDILWDRIVSIDYIGYEHVYDIEVEGTHNFIGNGIFAHNTYIGKLGSDPISTPKLGPKLGSDPISTDPISTPEDTGSDIIKAVSEDEIRSRMMPPEDKPALVGWMRDKDGKVQPVYSDSPRFESARPYVNDWNSLREIREVSLRIADVKAGNFQKSVDYQYLPEDLRELFDAGKVLVTAKEKDAEFPYSILMSCIIARNEQEKNAGRAGILLKNGIPVVLDINGKEFLLEIKGAGNPDGGYDYEYRNYPRGAITDIDSLSEFDVLERKRELAHGGDKGNIIRAAGNIVFEMDGAPIQQGYVLRLTPSTVRANFNFLFKGKEGLEATDKIGSAMGRQLAEFMCQGFMPDTHIENFVAIDNGDDFILTDYTDISPMHYLTLTELKDLIMYGLLSIIFDMPCYKESRHKEIFLRAIGEKMRELGRITLDEEQQFVKFTKDEDITDFIWKKVAAVEYYRSKRTYGWIPGVLLDFYETAAWRYFDPKFPGTVFSNADEAIRLTNSSEYREAYKKYVRMTLDGSFSSDKWDEVKSCFEILRRWGGSNSGLLSLLEHLRDEIKFLEIILDRAGEGEIEEIRKNIEIAKQRMAQLMEMNPHDFWIKMQEDPAFGVKMAMLPYFSNVKDDPVLAVTNEWKYYKSVLQPADGSVLDTNRSCGTVCEKGHEGSYDSLDNQLERQFGELREISITLSPGHPDKVGVRIGKGEGVLTEEEADRALVEYAKRFGIEVTVEELQGYRRQIKEAVEGVRSIKIFFSVPETGTGLFWVKEPLTPTLSPRGRGAGEGGWTYAGGHFNRAGTRMHISLPVILEYGIQTGIAIARHDLAHIEGEGHLDDEGLRLVKEIADKEGERYLKMVNGHRPLTYFGRDGNTLDYLVESAIEKLGEGEELNILTIGSSTGQEGYDVAMSVAQYLDRTGRKIKANLIITDLEQYLVDYAERGIYDIDDANRMRGEDGFNLPEEEREERYRKYFRPINDRICHVLPPQEFLTRWNISIRFQKLDILDQHAMDETVSKGRFNLIVSRNVQWGFRAETNKERGNRSSSVLINIDRILKDNGIVSLCYGLIKTNRRGAIRDMCAGALSREEINVYKEFEKLYFKSYSFGSVYYAICFNFVRHIVREIRSAQAREDNDALNELLDLLKSVGLTKLEHTRLLFIIMIDNEIEDELRKLFFEKLDFDRDSAIHILFQGHRYLHDEVFASLYEKLRQIITELDGSEAWDRVAEYVRKLTRLKVKAGKTRAKNERLVIVIDTDIANLGEYAQGLIKEIKNLEDSLAREGLDIKIFIYGGESLKSELDREKGKSRVIAIVKADNLRHRLYESIKDKMSIVAVDDKDMPNIDEGNLNYVPLVHMVRLAVRRAFGEDVVEQFRNLENVDMVIDNEGVLMIHLLPKARPVPASELRKRYEDEVLSISA